MPSETDVINDSLAQIGATPITGLDEGTVAANHAKRLYPALRDALIRSHHWNFAMARAELAEDATPPIFEFAFSYTLPDDLLKIVEYNGNDADGSRYVIEGRKLLTNDGNVKIVYLKRVTDPNQWDALFYQVVATALASKLASAITKDSQKSDALMKQAMFVHLPLAMAVDGQEGTVSPMISDALTSVR